MKEFHERLKSAMSIRDMTQSELCELTNIPKSAMSQYVSGAFTPKQERTYLLSKALNVNEAWLMGYDVPMERTPPTNLTFDNTPTDKPTPEQLQEALENIKEEISKVRDAVIESYAAADTTQHIIEAVTVEDLAKEFDNISPVNLKRFPMLGEIACGEPIWTDEDKESYVMADMDIKADFCLRAKGDSMIGARINEGDIVFIKRSEIVANGEIAAVIIDNEATLKRVYYYRDKNKLILSPENPKYEPLVYLNEELETIRILGKAVYFMSAL